MISINSNILVLAGGLVGVGSKFEPQVGYLINSGAQLIIVDTAPTI